MMNNIIPAEVFPPGDFIQEELDAREWTQEDLAKIMGKPLPTVNKIIKGKTSITPDTAKRLGAAFGNSAQFWLNLDSSWQLHQNDSTIDDVRERAEIYKMAPVREMVRRGWIKRDHSPEGIERELCWHFRVGSLDSVPEVKATARAAVRGEQDELSPEQWTWVCRCSHVSTLVDAKKFSKNDLRDCIPELMSLTLDPEEIRRVPQILTGVGVRLVVVQHLKRTLLDGAALQRNSNEPVIGVSLRYGRLDNFWFTLMHEIAHVLNGDGVMADSEICKVGNDVASVEEKANSMAAEWLVPQNELESFIRRTSPLYSTRRVENFARRIQVHPSIVVGQLKFRGEMEWDMLHRLNVDVRDIVRQSTVADGWGEVAAVR